MGDRKEYQGWSGILSSYLGTRVLLPLKTPPQVLQKYLRTASASGLALPNQQGAVLSGHTEAPYPQKMLRDPSKSACSMSQLHSPQQQQGQAWSQHGS